MEDQLNAHKKLNIPTAVLNSQTKREVTTETLHAMVDSSSDLKMVYVSPEMIAKSQRIMSQLEEAYRMSRLSRIAIDEVIS